MYHGILQKNSFFYRIAGIDAPPALLLKIAAVLTHQVLAAGMRPYISSV